jgi:hypothetical protein
MAQRKADQFDAEAIARKVAQRRHLIPASSDPVPSPHPNQVESGDHGAEGIVVPDFTDVMIGWRAWGVPDRTADQLDPLSFRYSPPLLQSPSHGHFEWEPRQPFVAVCGASPPPRCRYSKKKLMEVPGDGCSCGMYAAKTLEHLMSMNYHVYDAEQRGLFHVIGPVRLWGKLVQGTLGWRAQKAYPHKLYVPFEAWHLAPILRDLYGVPVELKNILKKEKEEQ